MAKKKSNNSYPDKAYFNRNFLGSKDARPIRILSEYMEPLSRFRRFGVRDTIVFFGSARAQPLKKVDALHEKALRERREKGKRAPRELRERIQRLEWDRTLAHYYEDSYELARLLSEWAQKLSKENRFVICSGGGPGIMEAANRGATEGAGAQSIGLTISLPTEEKPNPFITPELSFEFHYFFMRKLWFLYIAAALVVFPGGFGTLDELFEVLTLRQTNKVRRPIPIVLYGSKFWREVVDFDALIRWGTISEEDVKLFRVCNSPQEAFAYLRKNLQKHYKKPVGGRSIDKPGIL